MPELYVQNFLVGASLGLDSAAVDEAKDKLSKDRSPVLEVTLDAARSGVLTNRRVYPYKAVSSGHKSFSKDNGGTAKFNKPVLLHHDAFTDPVGRVVKSSFVPLKSGRDAMEDYLNPDTRGGEGSGIVVALAEIVNPEAIDKIMSGVYQTVSAGHSTSKFLCSICGEDMMRSSDCEHYPGGTYKIDGKERECYGIYGDITYHEVSFVNIPAQETAQVREYRWAKDSLASALKDSSPLPFVDNRDPIRSMILRDSEGSVVLVGSTGETVSSKLKTYFSAMPDVSITSIYTSQAPTILPREEDCGVTTFTSSGPEEKLRAAIQPDAEAQEGELTPVPERNEPMTDKKENQASGVSMETLQASLDALTQQVADLKAKVTTLEEERDNLQAKVGEKDTEVENLQKQIEETSADNAQRLALAVSVVRTVLNKPGAVTKVDSLETLKEAAEELTKRSEDSLKDSLTDLLVEFVSTKKSTTLTDSAAQPRSVSPVPHPATPEKDSGKQREDIFGLKI